MASILTLVDDLFFVVRIEDAARALGLQPLEQLETALADPDLRLVVLDLNVRRRPWGEYIALVQAARPSLPILAFGPHVDVASRRAAQAAGATRVVTKQQLAGDLPGLLRRYALSADPAPIPDDRDEWSDQG